MYKQLNSEQRYAICAMLQQGMIKNVIAKTIEVSNSTITRELQRNSNKRGVYNYDKSHRDAIRRRVKSVGNRSVSLTVKTHAIQLLVNEQWSPEQISGKLANEGINISHETIYKIIREDKKNFGTLYKSCRHRLKHRTKLVGARTAIKNRTSIHERPKEADGTRFGDFEMDTIVGKNCQDAILTITERKTNLLLMAKLEHGKDSTELAKTAVKLLKPYKKDIKTITTDNGTEFAAHSHITNELGVAVYFADPYASWQKGAIENANGLIRQYIPKGTSFKEIDDKFVENICIKLNARPRKKNNFHPPYECFQKYLC